MRETFPEVISPRKRISVDVFDTLLLRKPISERRRLFEVATLFSSRIPPPYKKPPPELVYEARVETQRWAYRALDAVDHDGEVRISEIFKRQLQLLVLPPELASLLMDVEIEVEKGVLVPNRPLIRWLQLQHSRAIPVIAISDTSLPATAIQILIEAVAGPNVIDRVYTSADLGLTKRKGRIFAEVVAREKTDAKEWMHFGDDKRADLQQGLAAGIESTHLPRPRFFVLRRKFDGLLFKAARVSTRKITQREPARPALSGPGHEHAFGRAVLGPIIARYCLRLWLYLSCTNQIGDASCALFCARGGLNLRVVFEAFLERLQLPLEVPRADFMISRLVAVRGALLMNSPAAFEEIGREFGLSTITAVARALAQSDIEFGPEWDIPYAPEALFRLMNSTAAGEKLKQRLTDQNALFEAHLQKLTEEKNRLVLCDTGLYGSTLRLLQAGFPRRRWECLLFARCNYKGFASAHFAKTAGLIVERDCYDPLHPPSTILRYWQFIENLFEPDLESVRTFAKSADNSIASNLETADWRERLAASRTPLLNGVLSYIADLPRDGWFERISLDEPDSWLAMKRAVLFSSKSDLEILSIGERSHDFGREGKIKGLSGERASDLRGKLALFRTSRWKEGLAAQEFPATRLLIQAALESGYAIRWLLRRMKPSSLRAFL